MYTTNELVDSLVEKVSGLFDSAGDAATIKAEIANNPASCCSKHR